MTEERLTLGKKGEAFAVKYLKKKGYKIKETNYLTPLGEIDIIATEGGTIVFVEVKTRSDMSFGFPFEAVNRRKQAQIIKSAHYYMLEKKIKEKPLRIDVVSIVASGGTMEAELIRNAFDAAP